MELFRKCFGCFLLKFFCAEYGIRTKRSKPMDVEMVDCVNNEQLPQNNIEQSENYASPSTNEEINQQDEESEEKVNLTEVNIERRNSSDNIFVEIPVEKRSRSNEDSPDSDDSVIFSNDGEEGFSLNSNIRPRRSCEPPKDLLSEVSEIIVSLSDDERFQEYINYSNGNGFVFSNGTEKRRTSVDVIFTYNVLNILFTKLKELKAFYELVHRENDRFVFCLCEFAILKWFQIKSVYGLFTGCRKKIVDRRLNT